MAYGEFKVNGDDVYEALTQYDSHYNRVLNSDGRKLAELIAEQVLGILAAKLALKLPDED